MNFDSVKDETFNNDDGDKVRQITFNYAGLDFIWRGYPEKMSLTINVYHDTNHDTVLDNVGISEPTKKDAIRCIKQFIKDSQ